LGSLGADKVDIETDAVYRDHIACGSKDRKGGTYDAT